MIAALMIFSLLFAAIFVVIVVLFLLDRASERIVVWCEAGASHVARWIADGIEGIIARPAWAHAVPPRFRKEQLKESKKIYTYLGVDWFESTRTARTAES